MKCLVVADRSLAWSYWLQNLLLFAEKELLPVRTIYFSDHVLRLARVDLTVFYASSSWL